MKKFPAHVLPLFLAISMVSCGPQKRLDRAKASHLHAWNTTLEAAIVNDFFTPPVASRIYAYPNIAAYEVLRANASDYPAIEVHEYEMIPVPSQELDTALAAFYAFYYTARELVYYVDTLDSFATRFFAEQQEGGAEETYGKQVADHIMQWANADGYPQIRSYPEYQLLETPGSWVPTPPDYTAAMEPHWPLLRSFTLDSASQFRPVPPTVFDLDTSSQFYRETMQVYHALGRNTEETEAQAKFWDCNPLVRKHQGHVTFAEKKLTPGGHWVNIGRIAMRRERTDLLESAHVYAVLSISIADAFISCWDAKYHYNYIRPVTVIQEHMDTDWTPILYTPNFPEYPSGHSVASGSAAIVLSHFFGEQYAFTDSTEVPYGMEPRSFNSFIEASEEAAISRLHGGIHFMPAIEEGKTQGRQVGQHVWAHLQPVKPKR